MVIIYLFISGYPYGSFKSDIEPSVSVNRSFAALFFLPVWANLVQKMVSISLSQGI
jgi:hypothetical protein